MIELLVSVCDGFSIFRNKTYVPYNWFEQTSEALQSFRHTIYGGLLDLQGGEFGPEYANGAFLMRLHFWKAGELHVTTKQQSDFYNFKKQYTCSEATMHLHTEPVLLDRFIEELNAVKFFSSEEAKLHCVYRPGA